ncbi:MAG TPA: hypothetical protein EYP08_04795, partial [Pyrodictiaceae archaeon]|nr:hypothetical protein [Pyrodictiaceae archaeon]
DALVLLLDEPGSGLDPRARDRLLETLRRLATRGMTIVFTTHDPGEAELADRVAVMHMGKVVIEGAPRELIARYAPKPRVRVKAPRHPSSLKARRLVAGLAEYEVEDEREAGLVAKVYSDEGIPIEWPELARPGLREVFYEVTGERLE